MSSCRQHNRVQHLLSLGWSPVHHGDHTTFTPRIRSTEPAAHHTHARAGPFDPIPRPRPARPAATKPNCPPTPPALPFGSASSAAAGLDEPLLQAPRAAPQVPRSHHQRHHRRRRRDGLRDGQRDGGGGGGPAAHARLHHRQRPRRAHGGRLRLARRAQARALRGLARQRHRRGRSAHHHHRRRELPGLPRGHPRRRAHGPLPRAVGQVRDQDPHRDRHLRRLLRPPLPRRLRRYRRARRLRRRGHRRRRAQAALRRLRRVLEQGHLRLRRLRRGRAHLPEQAHRRCRRRRLRHGGGKLPHQVRLKGLHHPPPQRLPRVQDHAGPRALQPQDPGRLGLRGRRGLRRRGRRPVGRRQGQERRQRRGLRPPGCRAFLCHRPRAGNQISWRAARARFRWVCGDKARLHAHQCQRGLRRRGRPGQEVPPGHYCRWIRLHGCFGCRALPAGGWSTGREDRLTISGPSSLQPYENSSVDANSCSLL